MDAVAGPESTRRDGIGAIAPGLLLAFSLNGFFVYLGVLDFAGVEPRTTLTGIYYLLVGTGLAAVVLHGRARLLARLREGGRPVRIWAVATGALATWFLITATLRSDGELAREAAILLVLAGVPSALATLTFDRQDVDWLVRGLVATGIAYAIVSAVALASLDERSARFSPIDELDPISAAKTAVLAAIACLLLRPGTQRGRIGQAAAVTVLVAAAVVPAGRGPLLALALAVAVVTVLDPRRLMRLLLPAVAVGLVLGVLAAERAGSTYYLGVSLPGLEGAPPIGADFTGERLPEYVADEPPISTASIRSKVLRDAVAAIPDALLLGHGVGKLRDESAETQRLIDLGRLTEEDTVTHPHNVLVESAYSLGLVGLALFLASVACAALALARLIARGRGQRSALLAAGFAAAAVVNSSLSGELGMDSYVWVALALPVALYASRAPTTSSK